MENIKEAANGNSPKRLLYIDILNILACFGVVAMHCTGKVFAFDTSKEWFFSMFLQTIFHFAIPVFFMITGVTLLNYREKYTTAVFFRKRVLKTIVPLAVWTAVMLVYKVAIGEMTFPTGPRSFINVFTNNEVQYIYWFFYAIIGIYLAMPLFSLIARKENLNTVKYFLIVFFAVRALLPLLPLIGIKITGFFEIPAIATYMGYVLMGWYLNNAPIKKRMRIVIYVCGLAGALLMFFGTFFLSHPFGRIDDLLMGYTSICTMSMSCALFLLLKQSQLRGLQKPRIIKVIGLLSKASLGIYILQMIPLNEIYRRYPSVCSIPMMIGETVLVYIICFAFTAVMQKIPGIRRVFP